MLSEAAASILSLFPLAAARARRRRRDRAGRDRDRRRRPRLHRPARPRRWDTAPAACRSSAARPRSPSARSGLPGWAALPAGIAAVALNVALLGMYWDISLHIDNGRDAGPLANPAHYLILAGPVRRLRRRRPRDRAARRSARARGAVRIARGWYAPVGGVLMAACGAFSLIAFPLDDLWHRLFGQDVTLWGPTHLMLIGGAGPVARRDSRCCWPRACAPAAPARAGDPRPPRASSCAPST